MNVWKNKGIRIGEVWFDEEPNGVSVDVIFYNQRSNPISGLPCRVFPTLLVDLSSDEASLLAAFKKDTRYEIKRAAENDGLVYEAWNASAPEVVDGFCQFYDRFALQKNLPRIKRAQIKSLARAASLDLSEIRAAHGVSLVWHAYVRVGNRVGLICSASHFREHADPGHRNLIGRANRYHHWRDMLRFRDEGLMIYDFGGWYPGSLDQEKLRINRFKEGFGGEVVKNYNLRRAVTLKGRVASWGARLIHGVGCS
jgi:hypothetical protein